MVTLAERQKAEKLMTSTGKKERKPRVSEAQLALKGFSTGEKDLYKEVGGVRKREIMETRAAEKRSLDFFASKSYGKQMPVPNKKQENKEVFGKNSEAALIEWEKN